MVEGESCDQIPGIAGRITARNHSGTTMHGFVAASRAMMLQGHTMDPINLYLIYPTRRHLPNRVRVFIDFVLDGLNKQRGPAYAIGG